MPAWHHAFLFLAVSASADHIQTSYLSEVLFAADPIADGSTFGRSWPGWGDDGAEYYGTTAGSTGSVTYGKQVAYDVMCLGGVRFREGSNVSAEYIFVNDFAGRSLVQVVEGCQEGTVAGCDMVGYLYKAYGFPAADYLKVDTFNAVFELGPYLIGTYGGLSPDATRPLTIEGYPALDLLFKASAGDAQFSNRYLGWFREGYMGEMDGFGEYYGKQPAYDTAPLYTIMLEDDYGRIAEYIINPDYAGLCLLEIVQKCMPDAWALRRNDGSQRWSEGHCEIGTLVSAKNLPGISDSLRLGVGDGEGAFKIQYRDWALFMPLKGNGGGNFAAKVWAFGSKGAANTGGGEGMVRIYGGPSLKCGTELPEKVQCYESGNRVMYNPQSEGFAETPSCGTVLERVCTDDLIPTTRIAWDDGETSRVYLSAIESLVECGPLPSYDLANPDTVLLELLFAADGMDPEYKNQYKGWFEPLMSDRRLEAGEDEGAAGIRQDAYWNMCLQGVRFADDSGAYAFYRYGVEHLFKPLGPIVASCLPGSPADRRNQDTMEWNTQHCEVGTLDRSSGVANASQTLRLGVGDAMKSTDPNYPDFNDWAVFMPVEGNAEHGYWEPSGGGNFATGVWAFGSKGVTNSLHDGPVYIYGLPAVMPLFRGIAGDAQFNNEFAGWTEAGAFVQNLQDFGKTVFYDTTQLSRLYIWDNTGNYAVYDLPAPHRGLTMLQIVSSCFESSDPANCEVGELERFGGPGLQSPSKKLRIGVGRNATDDWAVFAPTFNEYYGGFEESMIWSIGTKSKTNPGAAAGAEVAIMGGLLECEATVLPR